MRRLGGSLSELGKPRMKVQLTIQEDQDPTDSEIATALQSILAEIDEDNMELLYDCDEECGDKLLTFGEAKAVLGSSGVWAVLNELLSSFGTKESLSPPVKTKALDQCLRTEFSKLEKCKSMLVARSLFPAQVMKKTTELWCSKRTLLIDNAYDTSDKGGDGTISYKFMNLGGIRDSRERGYVGHFFSFLFTEEEHEELFVVPFNQFEKARYRKGNLFRKRFCVAFQTVCEAIDSRVLLSREAPFVFGDGEQVAFVKQREEENVLEFEFRLNGHASSSTKVQLDPFQLKLFVEHEGSAISVAVPRKTGWLCSAKAKISGSGRMVVKLKLTEEEEEEEEEEEPEPEPEPLEFKRRRERRLWRAFTLGKDEKQVWRQEVEKKVRERERFQKLQDRAGETETASFDKIGHGAAERLREFIPIGCLEDHLHDLPPEKAPLDWNTRMKIATGTAMCMEYLHDKANPPVIYGDFKSSNILLDNGFYPKLSDFGLANLGPVGDKTHVSTRGMGTYGYCAPEYAMTGQLTLKSDVYSFGVVLLELITGRKVIDNTRPAGEHNLVAWARPLFKDRRKFASMSDPLLVGRYPMHGLIKALEVAANCLQEEPANRPLIADVVTALNYLASQTYDPGSEELDLDEESPRQVKSIDDAGIQAGWERNSTSPGDHDRERAEAGTSYTQGGGVGG